MPTKILVIICIIVLPFLMLTSCKKKKEEVNHTTGICNSRNWHLITLGETQGPWLDTTGNIDTSLALTYIDNNTIAVLGDTLQWDVSSTGSIVSFSRLEYVKYGYTRSILYYYVAVDSIAYADSLFVTDRIISKRFLHTN